jgi:putative tryptophan/tyrosine transport system substrate-binding protein
MAYMKRFCLFTLLSLILASLSAGPGAQAAGKVYRVAFLTIAGPSGPFPKAVLDGVTRILAQKGYSADNLSIETRYADGHPDRLPALAKELVAWQADVIVLTSYPAARAVKESTATIPIVAAGIGDPVQAGLAASLSQPGGNLTGISDVSSELSAKRLEFLKSVAPDLKRVAMLWNANDVGMTARYRSAAEAAGVLGVAVQSLGVREPDDFDAAFTAMKQEMPDGILMVSDSLTNLNRKRVFEFAAVHRLPAIYEGESLVRDGGLMSYGGDIRETVERIAALTDRILKGAKPADLPFEQPTHFRLVINRKTADALGLAIPESLYERADEVIE